MNYWMIATMVLYLIPVIWFIAELDFVVESVRDTFPTMKEGHFAFAVLVIIFWPITAIVGILFGGDK